MKTLTKSVIGLYGVALLVNAAVVVYEKSQGYSNSFPLKIRGWVKWN